MEEHFACGGTCGGVADKANVCGTEGCPNKDMPFDACDCGSAESHKEQTEGAKDDM